jgi:hypothetical protein
MLVVVGNHKRHVNGILGLLCRLHFPSPVAFGGARELAYTRDHYVAFPDLPDRDGRVFNNKAAQVTAELWVSLPRTTLLNTSHSLDILGIMTGYIASICRISSDARRNLRPGQLVWLTKPVINS